MDVGKRVLYVGGLSECVTEELLHDLFSSYGVVSRVYVVRHKHSANSAGYAFVEMASAEQALAAVVALEGSVLAEHSLHLYVTPYASHPSGWRHTPCGCPSVKIDHARRRYSNIPSGPNQPGSVTSPGMDQSDDRVIASGLARRPKECGRYQQR